MWLFLIFVVVFLIYLLDYIIHNTRDGKLLNLIPGPKGIFFFGNITDFLLSPVPLFYRTRTLSNKYKNIFRAWVIAEKVVNIYNPQDTETLLSNPKYNTKSALYNFLHPWLKSGLLTSEGDKWHTRRKILTPAFHFNILRQFCKIFDSQSKDLVKRLQTEVGQKQTDIIPYITEFTLYSICETAMGTQLSSDSNKINAYKKAIHDIGNIIIHRLVRVWLHPPFIFNLTSFGRQQKKILKTLHNFTTDVIQERRFTMAGEISNQDDQGDDAMDSNKKKHAMLDLLLRAEAKDLIDEKGIREEVDTFMFEGHDTTSMALTYTLLLLANHEEIQDRIVEEIDAIFMDQEQEATIADLNNMKYLERCIKEALRLYPSVPFIARYVFEDVQLKDYLIPAKTTCHLQIFDMHRDAAIFPCPDVFDPDRFLPENCAKRHPFAYIPFSAGPRNCIGQRFALLEEKSVISKILRNFKLEPVTKIQDVVFTADLTLRSRDPIFVRFIPRIQ